MLGYRVKRDAGVSAETPRTCRDPTDQRHSGTVRGMLLIIQCCGSCMKEPTRDEVPSIYSHIWKKKIEKEKS